MNATSSRAHTVVTINFKQTFFEESKPTNQKKCKINLVDLAGSERQSTAGTDAKRQTEGSNINKSLSFLGKVINILADKAANKKDSQNTVVPYRESKLTRMLQNALGGNSKTTMIAAISPADISFDETYSTLLYANQVKQIRNKAKINENPKDKFIRQLREENEKLKEMIENKNALKGD
jgi:kinesin family protein 1